MSDTILITSKCALISKRPLIHSLSKIYMRIKFKCDLNSIFIVRTTFWFELANWWKMWDENEKKKRTPARKKFHQIFNEPLLKLPEITFMWHRTPAKISMIEEATTWFRSEMLNGKKIELHKGCKMWCVCMCACDEIKSIK